MDLERQGSTSTDVARAVWYLASPAMSTRLSGEVRLVVGEMEGRVLW
ncbi:hypothetical protein [Polyangium jinanense]|uniref:Uncharacterized protein n=1 Tax=Polyangium jinanense TaxID=2829994 RepID=A0A9X4AVA4_9BACT|nr:hypothetical protein [Polyangium jinanense]MDC3959520.1 hypothetical protein [Polyangium jinanense]MDC3986119.1 hypothetical protein [Polyangium jinanense]